jgi:hypothetical protein
MGRVKATTYLISFRSESFVTSDFVSCKFSPVVRVVIALRTLQIDRRRIESGFDAVNVLHVGFHLVHVRTVETAEATPIKAVLDV